LHPIIHPGSERHILPHTYIEENNYFSHAHGRVLYSMESKLKTVACDD
jgi:hypothetical protein